jgi:hypothetical protein
MTFFDDFLLLKVRTGGHGRPIRRPLEAAMPGDPQECRALARRCTELAATATSQNAKAAYFDLARQWTKLATDIEMAAAVSDRSRSQPWQRRRSMLRLVDGPDWD